MLCDACGRNNAVIHIVQAGPNGRVERDLCEECARNYSEYLLPFGKKDVSVNDFLKGVFSAPPEVQPKEEHKDGKELVCPACGKATRVAHRIVGERKVRACKKCGEPIEQ